MVEGRRATDPLGSLGEPVLILQGKGSMSFKITDVVGPIVCTTENIFGRS